MAEVVVDEHLRPVGGLLGADPLEALLEVGRLVDDAGSGTLPELLERVAAAVGHVLGFAVVVVNVYRPAWDDFEVAAVFGSGDVRQALLGKAISRPDFDRLLDERFRHGEAFLIKSGAFDWAAEGFATFTAFEQGDEDDQREWRPADALFVPMVGGDGELFGVVSVDEPQSGLRPSDAEIDLLVALVSRGAAAIESTQRRLRAEGQLRALEQLMGTSTRLRASLSVTESLKLVCDAIREALEFDKVAICLAEGDLLKTVSAAGWPPDDLPDLDLSVAQFQRLLVPEHETFGCYLFTHTEALDLIGDGAKSAYASVLNGNGPRAWHRHWLVVPLRGESGDVLGFVWGDDPFDRLLPRPERLQALRLFADQVTTTLEFAGKLSEIASLNEGRRALIDSAPIGIFELAADRTVRGWNPAAEQIFGWSAEEVIGRPNPIVPPREWDDHLARTDSVLKGGAAIYGGRERQRKDGSVVDVEMRVAPIRDLTGCVTGMVAMVEDVTSRLSTEKALRRSEELASKILNNTTDLISLIDLDGSVIFNSASFENILGSAASSRDGEGWGALIHPDDAPTAREMVDVALAGGAPAVTGIRVRHADGSWRILEGAPSVVRDNGGAPELIVSVLRDVTEKRALEARAEQAQRIEAVGRLTGGIAHDFNNLLTAIRGYAEIARGRIAGREPEAERALTESINASDRAAALTQQLLAFSRQQILMPTSLDLNVVVQDLHQLLLPLVGEQTMIKLDLADDTCPIDADLVQLEQVIVNLAINARDAMPTGGPLAISTRNVDLSPEWCARHEGSKPGNYVLLEIRDTGCGMSEATKAHLFEPFFTTKPVGEGTGLGLATVYGIVKQTNGYIDVESAVGVGTTVHVYIPRRAA